MMISRSSTQSEILSLEAAAAAARSGFACVFSSSDEYERALITERRARGRYATSRSAWLMMVIIALAVTIVAAVIYYM
jgi:hypothetical protein